MAVCAALWCAVEYSAPDARIYAADTPVANLLYEASGVTRTDAAEALKKTALSLYDAYALAVVRTETLAIQGEGVVQAEAKKRQALGVFLPKVYLRAAKALPDNSDNPPSSTSTGVNLYARQPITTGLQEWSQLKAASSEIKTARYRLANGAGLLLLDVASSYYRVLHIEKSLENSMQILDHYKQILIELNRRVAVGKSRRSEVLRTNTEMYKVEASVKALQDDLSRSRLDFAFVTGALPGSRLGGPDMLPDALIKQENIKALAAGRWDVKAASEEVEAAKSRLCAAWGGHLPSLYLEGTYRIYQEHRAGRDYYGAIGAELPLFGGGIPAAQVKVAESLKRQAELTMEQTLRAAEKDIAAALQRWEFSGREVEAYRKALRSAEENYRVTSDEYRMNLVTILDVLTSLNLMQSAKDDYEGAVLQHALDRLLLGVAVNELPGKGTAMLKNVSVEK